MTSIETAFRCKNASGHSHHAGTEAFTLIPKYSCSRIHIPFWFKEKITLEQTLSYWWGTCSQASLPHCPAGVCTRMGPLGLTGPILCTHVEPQGFIWACSLQHVGPQGFIWACPLHMCGAPGLHLGLISAHVWGPRVLLGLPSAHVWGPGLHLGLISAYVWGPRFSLGLPSAHVWGPGVHLGPPFEGRESCSYSGFLPWWGSEKAL